MKDLVITATNSITAVGHDGRMTAASVRAGISRFREHDDYLNEGGNPVIVAPIRGIDDENRDTAGRLAGLAGECLKQMLSQHFDAGAPRPSRIRLFLGVSTKGRPGPRYEERCARTLLDLIGDRTRDPALELVPYGNASMHRAVADAARVLDRSPDTLCIIGCIDSLLRESTLNWFEQSRRLKSHSFGCYQGLVAGEAVCFMAVEDGVRVRDAGRTGLARIAALGLGEEPAPRVSQSPNLGKGLSDACRAALGGVAAREIRAVFGDLNGEHARAMEWTRADIDCLDERHAERRLFAPAECYGDIGAASGAVLATIASQGLVRKWLTPPVLIFCSDDSGSCGAMVLERDGR